MRGEGIHHMWKVVQQHDMIMPAQYGIISFITVVNLAAAQRKLTEMGMRCAYFCAKDMPVGIMWHTGGEYAGQIKDADWAAELIQPLRGVMALTDEGSMYEKSMHPSATLLALGNPLAVIARMAEHSRLNPQIAADAPKLNVDRILFRRLVSRVVCAYEDAGKPCPLPPAINPRDGFDYEYVPGAA